MRINLKCATLLAVATTFGATAGFTQTMTAEVPFGFRVPGANLPPGAYTIQRLTPGGGAAILLRNRDTLKSAIVLASNTIGEGTHTRARMVFRCGEEGCTLLEIWGASSGEGVAIPRPREKRHDDDKLAAVYIAYPKKNNR